MTSVPTILDRLRTTLMLLLQVILGIILIALVSLETWQVVLRYVFGQGVVWGRDVATLLLMSLAWFGAPYLWLTRGHIAVDVLVEILPQRVGRVFERIINAVALAGAIAFVAIVISAIEAFSFIDLPSLGTSGAVKFYPLLAGGILLGVAALLNLLERKPS